MPNIAAMSKGEGARCKAQQLLNLWSEQPDQPGFYLVWSVVTVSGWCWCLLLFALGKHYLNHSNRWLEYGKEAILPFFMLHQPVIMVIAYYMVQWNAGIPLKLLTVLLSSFVVTLGFYDLLIRRVGLLRRLSGMKLSQEVRL